MNIFKKKGNYWIDFYFQGRRKRRKIGPNYEQARMAAYKKRVEIAEGRYLDVKPDHRHTLNEILDDFMRYSKVNKRSAWRDEIIIRHLKDFFGARKLSAITPGTVEEYKAARIEQGVKAATINRELAAMKCAFNNAIGSKKATANPVRSVPFMKEPPGRLRFLSKDEIDRLLLQCAPHLKPIVITALTTGMRRSEILGLKWQDVNFEQGLIMVTMSKSGKRREIDICSWLSATLRQHFSKAEDTSGYVFCKPDGAAVTRIRTAFEAAVRRAKIPDFHFHDLRHTCASWMIMTGSDLVTVRDTLGHSGISMTLRYSHLSKPHKKSAMEVLGAKLGARLDTPVDTSPKSANESIS